MALRSASHDRRTAAYSFQVDACLLKQRIGFRQFDKSGLGTVNEFVRSNEAAIVYSGGRSPLNTENRAAVGRHFHMQSRGARDVSLSPDFVGCMSAAR
jgi:hypothetical protein